MNVCDLLVIVYLFGEFGYIKYVENSGTTLYNEIQIQGESPKKIKQVKYARKKALDSLDYRSSLVEPARIKATKRKNKYKRHTHNEFRDIRPEHGKKSKRLWKKAKEAVFQYDKIKYGFDHGKFCNPQISPSICAEVFKNAFFKEENVSYDTSISVLDNGCIQVSDTIEIAHTYEVEYTMEYKLCNAKRKNEDGTESALIVYLQSAFKQPFFGGLRYFVLFLYLFDETTQQWIRPSDPSDPDNIDKGRLRYEAYLSLN